MAYTDYHTTPASNTSLASTSLQENNTRFKDLNDQIRQILADVKFSTCWRVDDAAELQAVTFSAGTIPETVIVNTLGAFAYDSADSSTADDGREVLVTTSGERYKVIVPVLRSYTVAGVPSASVIGKLIYVSDGTSNKRLAVSDGTNWRFPDGNIVS